MLNSLIANWFVRLYMGTHVTSALMARLPVPHPRALPDPMLVSRIARLATTLRHIPTEALEAHDAYVALQVLAARAYALSVPQMTQVLEATPRLPRALRTAILDGLEADAVSRR